MRKPSTLLSTLVCFWVPLLLVTSFYCATFAIETEVSGNEVNTDGKLANEEVTKTSPEGHNEEAKFKGFFKKPIPIFKPIPKPIPIVKPIPKPIPIVKPIPKPIPIVKPVYVPVYKPVPKPVIVKKPVPVFKPIPKPIPIVKPIPVFKPIPKPIPIVKPIPAVEQEEFLKPKPFFKKPIHKPFFKKPFFPPLPIHKPIPTP